MLNPSANELKRKRIKTTKLYLTITLGISSLLVLLGISFWLFDFKQTFLNLFSSSVWIVFYGVLFSSAEFFSKAYEFIYPYFEKRKEKVMSIY